MSLGMPNTTWSTPVALVGRELLAHLLGGAAQHVTGARWRRRRSPVESTIGGSGHTGGPVGLRERVVVEAHQRSTGSRRSAASRSRGPCRGPPCTRTALVIITLSFTNCPTGSVHSAMPCLVGVDVRLHLVDGGEVEAEGPDAVLARPCRTSAGCRTPPRSAGARRRRAWAARCGDCPSRSARPGTCSPRAPTSSGSPTRPRPTRRGSRRVVDVERGDLVRSGAAPGAELEPTVR